MKLKDRVAIVTGGARGIGRAITENLIADGAAVAIVDVNEEVAKATSAELNANGANTRAYKCNVANGTEVDEMVAQVVADFGKVDILVNNAGITRDGLMMRMSEQDWDLVININLKGTFNCTKAVSRPMMKQRYGKIINISSIVGVMGNAGQTNYCASKAGVLGLTKSSARELATRNITVNAIAPGYIQTEMTHVISDEAKAWFLDNIPMKKPGLPADVARVVSFFSSSDSDYVTGQTICVDGGMVMY